MEERQKKERGNDVDASDDTLGENTEQTPLAKEVKKSERKKLKGINPRRVANLFPACMFSERRKGRSSNGFPPFSGLGTAFDPPHYRIRDDLLVPKAMGIISSCIAAIMLVNFFLFNVYFLTYRRI